jgi:hypothetical protein
MTDELIVMPDAELALTLYLRERLAMLSPVPAYASGVRVATENPPASNPGRFVRIRRSGGTVVNLVEDAARLDAQIWHDSDRNRMALAQLVRAMLFLAKGTVMAAGILPVRTTIGQVVEFVGPGRFEDPLDSSREIILFTVEVRLRGAAA